MSRVQTLTDSEYEVLQAVRKLAKETETSHTASATIRQELEDIYYDLENLHGRETGEVIDELKRRIYGLLH